MRFDDHINHVCGKLASVQGIVHSLSSFLPPLILRRLYLTLAYPHILLHIIIWGGAPATKIFRLQVAQNKIMRGILSHDTRLVQPIHTADMLLHLDLLSIDSIIKHQSMRFFYRWAFSSRYQFLSSQYDDVIFHHGYRMRDGCLLRLPFSRLELHRQSAVVRCILLWNSLPSYIRNPIESFNVFNNKCYTYFKNSQN